MAATCKKPPPGSFSCTEAGASLHSSKEVASPVNRIVNHLARPMPRATAQVEPYVEVLGAELTVLFLLQFGGAPLHFSVDPWAGNAVVHRLGHEKTKALATSTNRVMQRRVPLAKRWLAQMLARTDAGMARPLKKPHRPHPAHHRQLCAALVAGGGSPKANKAGAVKMMVG